MKETLIIFLAAMLLVVPFFAHASYDISYSYTYTADYDQGYEDGYLDGMSYVPPWVWVALSVCGIVIIVLLNILIARR